MLGREGDKYLDRRHDYFVSTGLLISNWTIKVETI